MAEGLIMSWIIPQLKVCLNMKLDVHYSHFDRFWVTCHKVQNKAQLFSLCGFLHLIIVGFFPSWKCHGLCNTLVMSLSPSNAFETYLKHNMCRLLWPEAKNIKSNWSYTSLKYCREPFGLLDCQLDNNFQLAELI